MRCESLDARSEPGWVSLLTIHRNSCYGELPVSQCHGVLLNSDRMARALRKARSPWTAHACRVRGSPKHSVLKRPLFFPSSRKGDIGTQVPVTQQPSLLSQGENIAREGIKPNHSSWKFIYPVFSSRNLGFTNK